MIRPTPTHKTRFIRLVCFVLAYLLALPLSTFTPKTGASVAGDSGPTVPPVKMKKLPTRRNYQAAQRARWREGELLIRFRQNVSQSDIETFLQAKGAQRAGRLRGQSGIERLRLSTGMDPEAAAAILSAEPSVEFVEPNFLIYADEITPNDTRYSEQWALQNMGSGGGTYGSDIKAARGWELSVGSHQTVIAIIDSGVDMTHVEFRSNRWINTEEKLDGADEDQDGFVDDFQGWDFITDKNEIKDEQGHGTAVAGIVAARGHNNIGVAGVMWRAALMSLRVLDSTGTGDVAHAVEAVDYASTHGAKVINCSWGTEGNSVALRNSISRAAQSGVIVVASAGNSSSDIESAPHYPASFSLPNLIAVAATDSSDQLTQFASWGKTHVSIAAPGIDILSTKMGGDYQTISGSSASAPFVTGVAGLVKSLRPWLGAEKTKEIILRGARQVLPLSDKVASKGVVSAAGALETLRTLPPNEGMDESSADGGERSGNGNPGGSRTDGRPGANNGDRRRDGREFSVTPPARTQGAPGQGLPNLDELRRKQPTMPQIPDAIPSTRCSHQDPDCRSDKRQAAIVAPDGLLAWNQDRSVTGPLNEDNSQPVSDSPFRLFWSALSSPNAMLPLPQSSRTNFALAANGGLASASANYAPGPYTPNKANDGDRRGTNGEMWHSPSPGHTFPDWLQVDFQGSRTIDEVDVFTIQNNYSNPSEPTATMTFSLYGLTGFDVQYWTGTSWTTVPSGSVVGNNLVWRSVTFSPITTTKIRVTANASPDGYSRITELEAWGPARFNVALSSNGAIATASSTYTPGSHPASDANNGDRGMLPWGNGGGWHDAAPGNSFPDWLQIDFNGDKSIDEVDVFTIQDNYASPSQPTETMTFSLYGLTGYQVQYWSGSAWVTVPSGSVTSNNKVWRKFTFPSITTTKIRVQVTASVDGYSRIAEVEAYGVDASGTPTDYTTPRVDANNRTGQGGVDLLSGNANWRLPIVDLKGRAGLDLNLSLSYNSLVWTRDAATNSIKFDADRGTPSPGFRLGFPVIQLPYYNSQTGKNAYLLLTPSGGRTELRQTANPLVYEAADSSYLQLTNDGGTLTLRPTDGSQLTYALYNGQYQCTRIKDNNGNYISVSYYTDGRINTVTDTLARVIIFNYDAYLNLSSITQSWGGTTHTWATFGWGTQTISTGFTNQITGPQNNTTIPVLTQVGFADGTRYNFEYNTYAQVAVVRHYAEDNHQLSYTSYTHTLTTANDCPRVTETKGWAENWNGQNGVPAEVVTQYVAESSSVHKMILPDGTVYKEFYGTTWKKGLVTKTEFWSSATSTPPNEKVKWTETAYTQDDTSLSYQKNPRITETNIYDSSNNRNRTRIEYGDPGSVNEQWGLPSRIVEYAADATTEIRHTFIGYNLDAPYTSRRIIGLVSAIHVSDTHEWESIVYFSYDAGGSQLVATPTATAQHDDANYGASSLYRGNLTTVTRYDADDPENASKRMATQVGYDTNGSVIFTRDPLNHQTDLTYTDSFSDNLNHNTYAYLTKATPSLGPNDSAADFSSTIQYNYAFGGVTRTQGPVPGGQTQGAVQSFEYDAAGRISRVNNLVNNAYQRWVYDPAGHVSVYSIVQAGGQETFSTTVFDGLGRVRATSADNPNSTGGYTGQFTFYDLMGRTSKQSNPTEMTLLWAEAGDDAAGWAWTEQAYDWKSRPTKTTNSDGTVKEITYGGCGCAGGEVVTVRDEMGRRQRMTADVLGRPWKTEVLNWDQAQSVYSTTTSTYNSLNQVTSVFEQAGSNGTGRTTTFSYDGHARLIKKRTPTQTADTEYTYNADDTTSSIKDSRGAIATFTYNNRHQTTGITFNAPAGITLTPTIAFSYDAAGNRTAMSDGSGSVNYSYDRLSRLTSETRQFSGLAGSYTLGYSYNLANELTSVTDPTGASVSYAYDKMGRITGVNGSGYANVTSYASNMQYRAWGGLKNVTYGNGFTLNASYNSRLQMTNFQLNGAASQSGSPTIMKSQYDYYADGRVRSAHDVLDERMDRAFSYDHVGRLQEAYTGSEARDYLNQTQSGQQTGPYRQSYQLDVWGELTARTNRFWSFQTNYTATYVNGRNQDPAWQYDAAGNLLQDETLQYTWDAAGHNQEVRNLNNTRVITLVHDGDGQVTRRVETNPSSTTYYVRASALDGRVITELDALGQKIKGYVYGGSDLLAEQEQNSVKWQHTNPLTGSQGESLSSGEYVATLEPDPLGVNVGVEDPFVIQPASSDFEAEEGAPMLTGMNDGGCSAANPTCTRCSMDGFEMGCEQVGHLMDIGAATFETWATVSVTFRDGHRTTRSGRSTLPPGVDVRFTGQRAYDANFGLNLGSGLGNFSDGVNMAVVFGMSTTLSNVEGGGRAYGGFAHVSFSPQQTETREQRLIRETRNNVIDILNSNNGNNPCAQLFGGAANAIAALNAIPFTPGRIADFHTGIAMNIPTGPVAAGTTSVVPNSATVNTNGGFYQSFHIDSTGHAQQTPNFGGYGSNNPRSRALQMLHELGHTIVTGRNADGTPQFLLPVDGGNSALSRSNTQTVINACRAQLNALRN